MVDYMHPDHLHARFEDLGHALRNRKSGLVIQPTGYKTLRVGPASVAKELMHRIIWTMRNGPIPEGLVIDHIDGNPVNNTPGNLRCCTRSENQYNRKPQARRGVYPYGLCGRWYVKVQANKQMHHGGIFTDYNEACAAADALRAKLHGVYTRTEE